MALSYKTVLEQIISAAPLSNTKVPMAHRLYSVLTGVTYLDCREIVRYCESRLFVSISASRSISQYVSFGTSKRELDCRELKGFARTCDYANGFVYGLLRQDVMLHQDLPWGSSTYDHRSVKTGHPVRSAIHKH